MKAYYQRGIIQLYIPRSPAELLELVEKGLETELQDLNTGKNLGKKFNLKVNMDQERDAEEEYVPKENTEWNKLKMLTITINNPTYGSIIVEEKASVKLTTGKLYISVKNIEEMI